MGMINIAQVDINNKISDRFDDIEEEMEEFKTESKKIEQEIEELDTRFKNKLLLTEIEMQNDISKLKYNLNVRMNNEILRLENKILKSRIEFYDCLIFISIVFFALLTYVFVVIDLDRSVFLLALSIISSIVCVLISFNYYLKRKLKAHERED